LKKVEQQLDEKWRMSKKCHQHFREGNLGSATREKIGNEPKKSSHIFSREILGAPFRNFASGATLAHYATVCVCICKYVIALISLYHEKISTINQQDNTTNFLFSGRRA